MWRTLVVAALFLGMGTLAEVQEARAERGVLPAVGVVSLETFEAPLAALGEWLETGRHGLVWRPTAQAPGWRPYFNGRWLWCEDGWLWASEEPWGWATYHYGRWVEDPQYSWVWVPGTEWAPAWVEWRVGERVVGWAPLGAGVERLRPVLEHWVFVPVADFPNVHVAKVARDADRLRADWAGSRPASGLRAGATARAETPLFGGPARAFVEYRVGLPLPVTPLVEVRSPAALARVRGIGVFRPGYKPTFVFEKSRVVSDESQE